ncbi:MAG TPA: DUF6159 family protein [Vicinamibacterales bacterium]|nr:DUF6159 family protein [Vicinamibacterales bacterium]
MTRSFQLVSQSYRVLMQDKELMLLPLASGAVMSVVVATFVLAAGINAATLEAGGAALYLPMFFLYVALYAVGIFFQCAVVAGATERMRGGEPTIVTALAAASRHIVRIVLWACLAATVGMALRAIQDRVGLLGKVVVGLLGAAWSLATFFVVPVLVLEDVYIGDVLGRSVEIFKEHWGETMVGGASLGFVAFCAWVALAIATALLVSAVGTPGLVLLAVGGIALTIFFSALQGVYLASLYRFATEGVVPPGFDKAILQSAFIDKGR